MNTAPTYVGIVVTKAWVCVAVLPSGHSHKLAYNYSVASKLVALLKDLNPTAVLLNATHGRAVRLVVALALSSLPVVVPNRCRLRRFIQSHLYSPKTDALRAEVLAAFGAAKTPTAGTLTLSEAQTLNELSDRRTYVEGALDTRRDWLVEVNGAERRHTINHIRLLERELNDIDKRMRQALRRSSINQSPEGEEHKLFGMVRRWPSNSTVARCSMYLVLVLGVVLLILSAVIYDPPTTTEKNATDDSIPNANQVSGNTTVIRWDILVASIGGIIVGGTFAFGLERNVMGRKEAIVAGILIGGFGLFWIVTATFPALQNESFLKWTNSYLAAGGALGGTGFGFVLSRLF